VFVCITALRSLLLYRQQNAMNSIQLPAALIRLHNFGTRKYVTDLWFPPTSTSTLRTSGMLHGAASPKTEDVKKRHNPFVWSLSACQMFEFGASRVRNYVNSFYSCNSVLGSRKTITVNLKS